jgi:hypothetical protein
MMIRGHWIALWIGAALSGSMPASETFVPRGQTPISAERVPYNVSLYPHWMDEDGDCQDTREEVLIAESIIPVVFDADLCAVVSGLWFDPYVGRLTTDAALMDIVHFVPLPEVHRSGGHSWTAERRRQYANDVGDSSTLIAISSSSPDSRSDLGPDRWMPVRRDFRCEYVTRWVQVKRRWGLEISDSEMAAVRSTLEGCR